MRISTPEQRAGRLLRWYPPSWRARYGEEFVEFLAAELAERPRGAQRTLNVVASGVLARLSSIGLRGRPLDGTAQARSSLAVLACALAAFLALGLSIWSQLTIGWQWSSPDSLGTTVAVVAMSLGVLVFAALALCAAGPILWSVVAAARQHRAAGLGRPVVMLALGLAVVIIGSRHFGNGWPGTGGHPWSGQGLVPGGVAAFTWASTLSISSYWMHPHALLAFPAAEVAWMLASPIALITAVVGAAKILRRVELSERVLRFEVRLGQLAALAMVLFIGATGLWVALGDAGPRNLFRTGAIDRFALVAMTAALLLALQCTRRARRRGPELVTPART